MPLTWSSSFAGVVLLTLLAVPGRAAEAERIPPDFHAVARLAGFERPIEIRQSGLKRRVDLATDAVVQSTIADRAKGVLIVMTAAGRRRLALVFPLPREAADLPVPLDLAELGGAERMSRMGSASVAGRPCAQWRYVGYLGRNGVVCATAEGIVLQLKPDGRPTPLFEVETLEMARQDPHWFLPPPDYQIAALPGLGGAAKPAVAAKP
jgi:hypothetical protein